MRHQDVFAEITDVLNRTSGRICVIGSKKKSLPASIETSLVKRNFRVLEPNDLSVLRELVKSICSDKPSSRPKAAIKFFKRVFGGLDLDDQRFLQAILSNNGKLPRRADRLELRSKHTTGVTPALLLDLLGYIEGSKGISCKLLDSVSALRSILEQHMTGGAALESLYSEEIAQRKFQRRGNSFRCCGSTLLVKGLEFDHTIILRDPQWEARWGTHKDLYVALTRGSKSTLMIDLQDY